MVKNKEQKLILRMLPLQPNPDKLEALVNSTKKIHIEAKLKAKGLSSAGATPNSGSRPGE